MILSVKPVARCGTGALEVSSPRVGATSRVVVYLDALMDNICLRCPECLTEGCRAHPKQLRRGQSVMDANNRDVVGAFQKWIEEPIRHRVAGGGIRDAGVTGLPAAPAMDADSRQPVGKRNR